VTHRTLGILGTGQLGRMTALAAARLGARCVVLGPGGRESPAGQVAWDTIEADYMDEDALARLADLSDAVTYEFENVPAASVAFLEQRSVPVRPGARLLEVGQNRAAEKAFLNAIGIKTAPWRVVRAPADIPDGPGLLKTLRMGYDGKGQARMEGEPARALASVGGGPALWEGLVDFAAECSVIVARDVRGAVVTYGPARNTHAGGILASSEVPAGLDSATEGKALEMAMALAGAVDLVGVVGLELFVLPDGSLLANEIAPRPHNSGHWTIDACAVSQFENHARAALGLPVVELGRHSDAVMENLIGPEGMARVPALLSDPGACVHLYGKGETRPGRKMGHVTWLAR
jgi:5-(carboxyamino)imidazole ribonucleotide synthase